MSLPSELRATGTIAVDIGHRMIDIPLCEPVFDRWAGPLISNTFGNKPLLNADGEAVFAELAILRLLQHAGWQARWIEVYAAATRPKMFTNWKDAPLREQEHVPIAEEYINQVLQQTALANGGGYGGCWDVLAWQDDRILFAESKQRGKDRMRRTQSRWLAAGLSVGLSPENFLIVEWRLAGD